MQYQYKLAKTAIEHALQELYEAGKVVKLKRGCYMLADDDKPHLPHTLYPGGSSVTCSVIVYYENSAFKFVNGPDLSYLTFPNQQARIDIMDPDAPDFDIGAGVLLNVFQTNPGDPFSLGYTAVDFDLSQFAGSTVRFRAAEVDNIFVFNFAIDNVTCEAILIARPIPTLSEWGLIAMAGVLGIIGLLAIRRRKVTT